MSDLFSEGQTEELWGQFKTFLCSPYSRNPETLAGMNGWFEELYGRKSTDGLKLDRYDISLPTGRSFDAFCLNGQMFFGHDAATLTLPYPCNPAGITTDRTDIVAPREFSGIWLHDFGQPPTDFPKTPHGYFGLPHPLYMTAELLCAPNIQLTYLRNVITDIHRGVNDGELVTTQSNGLFIGSVFKKGVFHLDVNTSGTGQGKDDKHADGCFALPHQKRIQGNIKGIWKRTIIHPIEGIGTVFYLGTSQNIRVSCPVGAVSSHIGIASRTLEGALHGAGVHPKKRVIMVGQTDAVAINDAPYPWRIRSILNSQSQHA